jgi:hypothetical protein
MWSWANGGLDRHLRSETWRLRIFGEARAVTRLAEGHWDAEETDGWEMTSLAAHLLGAEAVYRAPMEHVMCFMLLRDFRHG